MNQKKAKRLRSLLRGADSKKLAQILLLIRNEYGTATTDMTETTLYRKAKQLYLDGKLNI